MYTLDAAGYVLRFSPRRPDSLWSLNNRTLAESLIADGRMTPAGLAAGGLSLSVAPPSPRAERGTGGVR